MPRIYANDKTPSDLIMANKFSFLSNSLLCGVPKNKIDTFKEFRTLQIDLQTYPVFQWTANLMYLTFVSWVFYWLVSLNLY